MRITRTTRLSLLLLLLLAVGLYASVHWIRRELPPNAITLTPTKPSFTLSEPVTINVVNNTDRELLVENKCPKQPLEVLRQEDGKQSPREAEAADRTCDDTTVVLTPHLIYQIDYSPWQSQLFDQPGTYTINLEAEGYGSIYSTKVTITQ